VRIEVVRGDLTGARTDAVVNAANSSLLGGGGVDGALHQAAGPELLRACRLVRATTHPGGLGTGDAVATLGGELPARFVIHTVGPVHDEHPGGGPDLLASCHRRSLEVAAVLGIGSVAFPAISCGAYGWRTEHAAPIAVAAVRAFAGSVPDSGVDLVQFVLVSDRAFADFDRAVR
jgi:O-acetyl-ADP-ribose deacetylase (regulator of RNase III)